MATIRTSKEYHDEINELLKLNEQARFVGEKKLGVGQRQEQLRGSIAELEQRLSVLQKEKDDYEAAQRRKHEKPVPRFERIAEKRNQQLQNGDDVSGSAACNEVKQVQGTCQKDQTVEQHLDDELLKDGKMAVVDYSAWLSQRGDTSLVHTSKAGRDAIRDTVKDFHDAQKAMVLTELEDVTKLR